MIEELDRWGVKFEKDETGDYAMRKVHHMGSYVLPMPEGPSNTTHSPGVTDKSTWCSTCSSALFWWCSVKRLDTCFMCSIERLSEFLRGVQACNTDDTSSWV